MAEQILYPFGDSRAESFISISRRASGRQSTSDDAAISSATDLQQRRVSKIKSYRLVGEYQQPWLKDKRLTRHKYGNAIVLSLFVCGILLSGYICFSLFRSVPRHKYCLVLDEDFKTIDPTIWNHEVQIGGFGTGSFEWTTTDSSNSFVSADGLHIMPTLTNETTSISSNLIYDGYTLNLTTDGTCTSTVESSCSIRSNHTAGTIIPPVRSARLNTQGKKTIKYGRVEVVAKMPAGDWLWPAIWMMPNKSNYGEWPRSGEIDIVEARGNNYSYPIGGRNSIVSTLHWGPYPVADNFWRTTQSLALQRSDFSKAYHTFGLEWSEKYLYMYLDTRLIQVLYVDFHLDGNFWNRGKFSDFVVNNTQTDNPWADSPNSSAPFDEDFYLILSLAVGSRNGFFPDSLGQKPWVDASNTKCIWDFWNSADKWLPTWGKGNDRSLNIKSVKMWQQGACK